MQVVTAYALLTLLVVGWAYVFLLSALGPYNPQIKRGFRPIKRACIRTQRRFNWVVENLFGPVIILLSAYILYLAVTVGSGTFTY